MESIFKILPLAAVAFASRAEDGRYAFEAHIDTLSEAMAYAESSTNYWGRDAARISDMFYGYRGIVNLFFRDYPQQELPPVFCFFMEAQIPADCSVEGTNAWLQAKYRASDNLWGSRAVRESTNCWFACAEEYARTAPLSNLKWYRMAGMDPSLITENPDGTVYIDAPPEKRDPLGGRHWITIHPDGVSDFYIYPGAGLEPPEYPELDKLFSTIALYRDRLKYFLSEVPKSSTFASLPVEERNALVSHLVSKAGLDDIAARELGLTNQSPKAGD